MDTIMTKRFLIAWIAIFVVWFAGTFVVNVMVIDYSPIMHQFRAWDDEVRRFPLLILTDLMMAATFVWFYARLVTPKHWFWQGACFGFAVALFEVVPMYVRNYVAQPVPEALLLQQLVYFIILMMFLGVIVAFAYRNARGPAVGS